MIINHDEIVQYGTEKWAHLKEFPGFSIKYIVYFPGLIKQHKIRADAKDSTAMNL